MLNNKDMGVIKGKGTSTSDSINAELKEGDFIIPAKMAKKVVAKKLIKHLGINSKDKLKGGEVDVKVSDGEVRIPKGLVRKANIWLKGNGIKGGLNELAPQAESKLADGGVVGGVKKQLLEQGFDWDATGATEKDLADMYVKYLEKRKVGENVDLLEFAQLSAPKKEQPEGTIQTLPMQDPAVKYAGSNTQAENLNVKKIKGEGSEYQDKLKKPALQNVLDKREEKKKPSIELGVGSNADRVIKMVNGGEVPDINTMRKELNKAGYIIGYNKKGVGYKYFPDEQITSLYEEYLGRTKGDEEVASKVTEKSTEDNYDFLKESKESSFIDDAVGSKNVNKEKVGETPEWVYQTPEWLEEQPSGNKSVQGTTATQTKSNVTTPKTEEDKGGRNFLSNLETGIGAAQFITGAAALASQGKRPEYEVPETLKSIFATAQERAKYGFDPAVRNQYLRNIELQKNMALKNAVSDSAGVTQASQLGILRQTQAALGDYAVAEQGLREQRIGQSYNIGQMLSQYEDTKTKERLSQYDKTQQAWGDTMRLGLDNIVGAMKFREYLRMLDKYNQGSTKI